MAVFNFLQFRLSESESLISFVVRFSMETKVDRIHLEDPSLKCQPQQL